MDDHMEMSHAVLFNAGRILMGLIFFASVFLDLKSRTAIFDLMREKHVIFPWFCFIGALCLKTITSIAIILNFQTSKAAILLALYIFIANIIFNNFWMVEAEKKDFILALFLIHLSACAGLLAIAGGFNK